MSDLSHDRVAQLCEDLKLPGILDTYTALASAASEQVQSFTDFLENALTAERDFRRARSAAALIRMAGFSAVKTLEDYNFKFASAAPKRQIEQLASLAFVSRKENAVFLGPCSPLYLNQWRTNGSPSAKPTSPLPWGTRRPVPGSKPSSLPPLI